MTLLDAAKAWARERGVGFRQRWVKATEAYELVLHLGELGDVEITWAEWMSRAHVRTRNGFHRVMTPRSMNILLSSLAKHRGARLCQSPRHADTGCPACGLARRGAGRKRMQKVEIPKLQRVRPVQVLPPDEVPDERLKSLRPQPKTVEEAEAELERLLREDAPPEALRAAGARLDAALERRPPN